MLEKVEEDRIEEIYKNIAELLAPIENKEMEDMFACFDDSPKEIVDDIYHILHDFFAGLEQKQTTGEFGKLTLIKVSPMDVELYRKQYKLRIYAYDDRTLDSRREFCVGWNPEYITKYYTPRVDFLEKELPKRMFRMTSREIMLIRLLYAKRFSFFMSMLMDVLLLVFKDSIYKSEVLTDYNCLISFGEYLSEDVIFFPLEGKED